MTREEVFKDIQDEIFKEEEVIKRRKLNKNIIKYLLIFVVCVLFFLIYITFFSTNGFIMKEYRIKNNKIPSELNGLKIVQFSDLHYGSTIYLDDVKKIVKMINDCEPDIVVFTGDLINKDYKLKNKEREDLIKEISKINSSVGNYSILGEEDSDDFTTIFNQSNFNILNNEYEVIYVDNNNPILLSGISYTKDNSQYYKAYDYFNSENANSNIYDISLIHQPDTIDELKGRFNSDLYLAGHSHNGNIRVPFIGSIFNKEGSMKYHNDYYEVNKTPLYISSGIGTNNKLGFRLFCRPSISLYRLSNN